MTNRLIPGFKIEDGILLKCYDNGYEIIEVPDTVTEIAENAFVSCENCKQIKEIILPNTVKRSIITLSVRIGGISPLKKSISRQASSGFRQICLTAITESRRYSLTMAVTLRKNIWGNAMMHRFLT